MDLPLAAIKHLLKYKLDFEKILRICLILKHCGMHHTYSFENNPAILTQIE